MHRLLDIFRRRNGRNGRNDDHENDAVRLPPLPPLPYLPAQRRPITPTATIDAIPDRVAALGRFACLPPELRRRILVAAFGNRTLHLDLRFDSAGQRPRRSSADYEHGRGAAPLCRSRQPQVTTKTADWEWRWYGCVCHRFLPRGSATERRLHARGIASYQWPHRDACLRGESAMCQFWPPGPVIENGMGEPIVTCDSAVGAMGWLRACRQAYVEGIEVLYATDTFSIESRDLVDVLLGPSDQASPCVPPPDRHLVLPQRLSAVRSLELRLELVLFGDPPPLPHNLSPGNLRIKRHQMSKMHKLPNLAGLKTSFPNLRSLVVSFSDGLYNDSTIRPANSLLSVDRALFLPLAIAFANIAPQQDKPIVVEVPSNVFVDLKNLQLQEEPRDESWGDGKGTWLRYPIGDSSSYYYIKQGEESNLYWDYEGNARRQASRPSVLL